MWRSSRPRALVVRCRSRLVIRSRPWCDESLKICEGRGLGAAREREKTVPIFLNDGRVWWAAGAGCAVDLRSQWLEGVRVIWVEDRGAKTAQY